MGCLCGSPLTGVILCLAPVTQVALGPCTPMLAAAHKVRRRRNGLTPVWGPPTGARAGPAQSPNQKIPGKYLQQLSSFRICDTNWSLRGKKCFHGQGQFTPARIANGGVKLVTPSWGLTYCRVPSTVQAKDHQWDVHRVTTGKVPGFAGMHSQKGGTHKSPSMIQPTWPWSCTRSPYVGCFSPEVVITGGWPMTWLAYKAVICPIGVAIATTHGDMV